MLFISFSLNQKKEKKKKKEDPSSKNKSRISNPPACCIATMDLRFPQLLKPTLAT